MAAFVPHRSNKYFHVIASNGIVPSSPYIMTASPTASVRVFETIRDADVVTLRSVRSQRCRCEIIVLNDHRFGGSFWPFIVRQHAPIVHPWPCRPPQRPTARAVSSFGPYRTCVDLDQQAYAAFDFLCSRCPASPSRHRFGPRHPIGLCLNTSSAID